MIYQKIILFLITAFLVSCRESSDSSSDVVFSEPLITQTLEKVRETYVEKPDEKKMMEGALNGMLMALDPYCGFLNQQSYKIFIESTKGEFSGLGMEIYFGDGIIKVIAPMDDMPAQKAGIKAGDMITHVDDISLIGLTPEDILKRLHGKPGTTVSLKISRGIAEPFTIQVKRDTIVVNPIKYRTEGTIGYIRIRYFNDQTTDKLKQTIEAIQKSLGKTLRGIVLDLRNNPGGTLEQALSVSDLFLDAGKVIVHVKGRKASKNQTFKAKGKDVLDALPVAILINKGSASASEIVAGALRDNRRAILVGEKSFGKGSIQALYDIGKFGGIKLTVARFYTPNGDEIQGHGVQPDILLNKPRTELPKEKGEEEKDDTQLHRAIDLLHGLWIVRIRP
jgi:carboxyl-terminal processing protease